MGETFNQFLELLKSNTTFAIIVTVGFLVIMLLSLAIIFYKIKEHAWKALIPIYNIMALMEILKIPVWMILVMVIPFVNFVGFPLMMIILGWKLGNYCNKGIFMKLGLALLPPLFIPILSMTYIDLDGTNHYVEPVKLPDDFSLDAIEVSNVNMNLMAMSLGDATVLEKIAPPMATREIEPPKVENAPKKDFKALDMGASSNEVEDLKKVLPTADDLTFDYNSLYQKQEEEKVMEATPTESVEVSDSKEESFPLPTPTEESSTFNYDKLYSSNSLETEEEKVEPEPVEEPVEEAPKIVIHDVVLEAAEPVESLGPIPINRRYDLQNKRNTTTEKAATSFDSSIEPSSEAPLEINPTVPPVIAPIMANQIEQKESAPVNSDFNLPMQATSPFEGELPSLAELPDLSLPEIADVSLTMPSEINLSEVAIQGLREQNEVEAGTRVDQIVSMNIAEPSQLPVGVLTKPPGKQEETAIPDPEPVPIPVPEPTPVQPPREMTRAEAMGISQTFFTNVVPSETAIPPVSPNPNTSNIFQTGIPAIDNPNVYQQPVAIAPNMGMPAANAMPPVQNSNVPQPMNNPVAIFQSNNPNGGPLLRPVESNIPPAEKNCPVCGVKLKQECPICIMCGYKF